MIHRVGAATLLAVLVLGISLALTLPVRADLHTGLTDTVEETVDTTVEVVDETVDETEDTLVATVEDAEELLTTTTTTTIKTTTTTTTTATTSRASPSPTTTGGTATSDDAALTDSESGDSDDETGLVVGVGQSPGSGSTDDQVPSRLDRLSVLASAGGLSDWSVSETTETTATVDSSLYGRLLDWLSGSGSGLGVLAGPLLGLDILIRALLSAGSGLVAPISLLAAFVVRLLVVERKRRGGALREALSGG